MAGRSLLFPAALTVISSKTQFFDQVQTNSTSQLINGIFRVLHQLLKYFSGITISVLFLLALPALSLPL